MYQLADKKEYLNMARVPQIRRRFVPVMDRLQFKIKAIKILTKSEFSHEKKEILGIYNK